MFNQHELPGYVTTTVPIDDLEFIEFGDFFGACAAITQFRASDQDKEDANLVHVCFQTNVHAPYRAHNLWLLGYTASKSAQLDLRTRRLGHDQPHMGTHEYGGQCMPGPCTRLGCLSRAISYQHHSSEDGRIFMVGMASCPAPVLETVDTLHLLSLIHI